MIGYWYGVADDWVARLADIADEQVAPLAAARSRSEFWIGAGTEDADVAELAEFIRQLHSVARAVGPAPDEGMFAWAII